MGVIVCLFIAIALTINFIWQDKYDRLDFERFKLEAKLKEVEGYDNYDWLLKQSEKVGDYQRALRFYAKAHRGDLHADAGMIARQILDKEEKPNE
ncbi:MAG: hypothetical protein WD512_06620 [Candidatus Paceibacterota bacterium]